MASVREYTDPFLSTYTAPAPAADGVCDVCHSTTVLAPDGTFYARCYSCRETVAGVRRPVRLIIPISLYRLNEQLHTVLKDYKRSSVKRVRERHRLQVAAMLHRFLRAHRDCIERAADEPGTRLPSSPRSLRSARPEPHALEAAIRLGPLRDEYRPLLECVRPELVDRRRSSDDAFEATADAAGLHLLLVDDTFTSGATFQSAASALARGGATVVAGVVVGRVVDTSDGRYPEKLEFWECQRAAPFSFDICCLEDG